MPFVYGPVRSLIDKPLQGNGSSVALVKLYAPGLKGISTPNWEPGVKVVGSTGLAPGTAIATFVNGKYPRQKTGNHAAFFLAYAGASIWVVDQWPDDKHRDKVEKRLIHHRNPMPNGTYAEPSNSAGAYSVIELRKCAPRC